MSLPVDPIPAPGFKLVSGKRGPKNDGKEYTVQFSNGFIDWKHRYKADQLRWVHEGSAWDVAAVKDADAVTVSAARPANGSYV